MATSVNCYDYDLPPELIAQHPLPKRSDARLLVVDRKQGTLEHCHIRDLLEFFRGGDRLVFNDTRVVAARLSGRRTETGGNWQGLFLSVNEEGLWRILGKTRGKLVAGELITLLDRDARPSIQLLLVERQAGGVWLAHAETNESAWEVLDRVGRVPLPHFIRGGGMVTSDWHQYQPVFARESGSAGPVPGCRRL